ncbi:MAG TPA: hypothetical protein VEU51_01995 [Candidatus Acidoferrales bacterium]|nr:hypothetical protein [Candidatus Acidoferrales bacterium]
MSREDLWKVVGRARFDLDFGGRLQQDFEKTVADSGYHLNADEIADASDAIKRLLVNGPGEVIAQMAPTAAEQAVMHRLRIEQFERMGRLTEYMFETVKQTFRSARMTYKSITWMNWVMFVTGIGLFIFSALYAVYAHEKAYSLLFGGLGVSSFVALFILGPIGKVQKALVNLVQSEIAFMNYFDQQSFWEGYANLMVGMPPQPDPARIEKASASLQERSRETIEMLQRYVDDEARGRRRWPWTKKEPGKSRGADPNASPVKF